MAEPSSPRFLGLLRCLLRYEVDFCIVGGVAAQLAGAPILTLDLDILYTRSPENTRRLLAALAELKARYRDPAGRHIEPDPARLDSMRMHLLITALGPLDVLAEIGGGLTYENLIGRMVSYQLGETSVRVLELAAVIETKEFADREKDRATLPVLRQTLALLRAPNDDPGPIA